MNKAYINSKTSTGNIAVDMVRACLSHYKEMRRKVQYVELSANYWKLFSEWLKRNAPDKPFTDEGVQFRNTIIRKGHRFMTENLQVVFYPDPKPAEA
jgi:hypothetical protein